MNTAQNATERDETGNLISSSKVEGTKVYNTAREHLGSIHHFMVGKRSGKVEYAVMSFGGFLGMGESYHPLPWDVLSYDTDQNGYVVDIDKDRLKGAPHYGVNEEPAYDRAYGRSVYDYYGISY
ncbi:PRC-barrel domain-containing protein [Sphingomonas flavalba]|uniref:PRC-barrel domain-containing protein n=1 Tax=Sphingomonas flavalba TaxID=2559804 RepID=UPI0039DF5107